MVVLSVKTKLKWILGGLLILLCLAVLVTAVSLNIRGEDWATAADLKYRVTVQDSKDHITFLSQFGWEVQEEPLEVSEVVIPGEFNDVYQQYNNVQIQQGLDLSKYRGQTCKKWVYQITNYPDPNETVRATLLVLDGKVIGGDISSAALGGFLYSFLGKPTGDTQETSASTVEYAETMVEAAVPDNAWPTD